MIIGAVLDGVRGAIIGTVVGLIVGAFIAKTFGAVLFYWACSAWMAIQEFINQIGTKGTKFIHGSFGRVSIQELQKVHNTRTIKLFSRLNASTIDTTRKLHTATTERLASAGHRANLKLYKFEVPEGVIVKLEKIDAVIITTTQDAGRQGLEYAFTPEGAAYISQFIK
ncbi:hypothetical protein AAEX28_15195 [Lentisphaerota bacterium WC36G]|nr:hypothetical protein LJT99_01965 [Lentisphaerae bacterium WC36]